MGGLNQDLRRKHLGSRGKEKKGNGVKRSSMRNARVTGLQISLSQKREQWEEDGWCRHWETREQRNARECPRIDRRQRKEQAIKSMRRGKLSGKVTLNDSPKGRGFKQTMQDSDSGQRREDSVFPKASKDAENFGFQLGGRVPVLGRFTQFPLESRGRKGEVTTDVCFSRTTASVEAALASTKRKGEIARDWFLRGGLSE